MGQEESMDRKRRKRIIRNIGVAFLAVMLVLTFFSNTIMNWSLVEVETGKVESGAITTEIRDTVPVETISTYQVSLPQSRKIESIHIALGDEVKEGDLLFTLGETDESDALEALENELSQLRLEYQTALLEEPLPSYITDNAEIAVLQKSLDQAKAERKALGETNLTLTEAQTKLNDAQNKLSQQTASADKIKSQLSQIETNDITYPGIREEVIALQEANYLLSQSQNAYDRETATLGGQGYPELLQAIETVQQEIEWMASDDPALAQAQARLFDLQTKRDALAPTYTALERAKSAADLAEAALERKKQTENEKMLSQYDSACANVEEAARNAKKAEDEFNTVKRIKDAEGAVTAAQNALNAKILSLQVQQETDQKEQGKKRLRLDDLAAQISKKESELDEMRQTLIGGEVRAKCGGIVSSMSAQVETLALKDEVLAEISVVDVGFEAVIRVEEKLSAQVTVGMKAQCSMDGRGGELTAEVISIRADVEGRTGQKLVVLKLQGDVAIGRYVTVTLPLSSQNFDTIVPKSALFADDTGYFLLLLKAKGSPLGNRYYVEKASVDIVAQNSSMAAVEGDVGYGDEIVIRASGILNGGDFVRLKQNTNA